MIGETCSSPLVKGQSPAEFVLRAEGKMDRGKMIEDEDTVLVTRAKAGDTVAFDGLVIKYGPKLYGLVYHMTSSHEDTNDLLQEIFAKAYRSLRKFREKSKFYTWIYRK